MKIRVLEREELRDVWSIDRAEVIDHVYHQEDGELVLKPEHYDMPGWPPGEPEHYGPLLLDCFDRGGSCYGAFDGDTLVVAKLDRLTGSNLFLHPVQQRRFTYRCIHQVVVVITELDDRGFAFDATVCHHQVSQRDTALFLRKLVRLNPV